MSHLLRANRRKGWLAVIFLIAASTVTACESFVAEVPTQSLPSPVATAVPSPTPAPVVLPATPEPAPSGLGNSGGYAPGTVIAEQVFQLAATQPGESGLSFESGANQVIAVHATQPGTSLAYQMVLTDKFGNSLVQLTSQRGRSSEAVSEITLPYEGAYRLAITPTEGDGTLQVTVSALESATGGGYVEHLPVHFSGRFDSRGVYHLYQFPLQRGEAVTVEALAEDDNLDKVGLALIGPDGRQVATADTLESIQTGQARLAGFTASVAGTYIAMVTNPTEQIGAYTFNVTLDTEPPPPEGAPDIGYDQVVQAAFADQSVLHVTFEGAAGDVLRIDVTDPDKTLDLDLYVLSPFDQIIAYAIDSEPGVGEALNELQLPYSGRYQLDLYPTGSGEASFSITRLSPEFLTGGGAFGDAQFARSSGTFSAPDVFHYYQFQAAADDRISILIHRAEAVSSLAAGLSLLSPSGEEIASDQALSSNEPDPAVLEMPISQTGTYTLIVYALNGTSGSYDLEFSRN